MDPEEQRRSSVEIEMLYKYRVFFNHYFEFIREELKEVISYPSQGDHGGMEFRSSDTKL